MPRFRYLAKRGPQELIEGVLDAESRATALSRLTSLGYIPVRIAETAAESKPAEPAVVRDGKVPVRQLNQFTRQFASLVRSAVPLLRALTIMEEQASHPHLRRVIGVIGEDIRQGQTLSGALAKFPTVFSPLYVSLVRSGEIAGMLDTVLDRLAAQADRDEALRAKLQAALAYPLFVGVAGVATVAFLLTFVMPRLLKLFEGFGSQLPMVTRVLLLVSQWCASGWFWGIAATAALVLGVLFRSHRAKGRALLDRLSLHLPLIGILIRQLELARFSRAFGLLLDHGIPILQAVEVATPVVRNQAIRKQLARLPAQLKEGSPLAPCLKALAISTPFVIHAVAVGEESGKVSDALLEVANFYEREVERLLQIMAGLLEPAMILAVGAVVGFIVMAVLLPVLEMGMVVR
ncbi:MAG: type II secretion system F family protein [Candidatus Omnitrophica bacterium]|nr:type II secretion system F family protein [Candidatus Omnitrophota bacterium]